MPRKVWNICKPNKELASQIAERYSIDPFAALLLVERGIDTPEAVDAFLAEPAEWEDPFLLPDMQKAVDRINEAIFAGERICVYGDYDCDGVTSTALLYTYLESQGADVTYLLPDRHRDGYGLSMGVVDRIRELGTDLIITVDNGISAVGEAKRIRELGMDLIITDHHLEGETLPDSVAIVDPHRKDWDCPFQDYAGVGVALKLCCAIEGSSSRVMEDLADLAAIGTVADMVPLQGENRRIVQYGLRLINRSPRPGVRAILEKAGLGEKPVHSAEISFGIAPRINAAGRMESAEHALDLLLAEEPETADQLAEEINELNRQRHQEEDHIFREASAYLREHPEVAHAPVLVVAGEGWHEGVLGIVASKLLEKYLRPVIVLSCTDGLAKGSARSVEGFSIYEAIAHCADLLNTFGGHELAAGLSLPAGDVAAFREAINQYADTLPRTYPRTNIDFRLFPESISLDLLSAIEVLEPFGMTNQSPVFGLFRMTIDSVSSMGENGVHKRIQMHREGRPGRVSAIRFHAPDFPYREGDVVDTVVTLNRNLYNGHESVSVFLQDIRPAAADDETMVHSEVLFDHLYSGRSLTPEEAAVARPDRAVFADIYPFLRSRNGLPYRAYEYIHASTAGRGNGAPPLLHTMVALEAMRELGLLETDETGAIRLTKPAGKVDLNTAPILQKLDSIIATRR
ncbi:MAG: single-stranded-DNA-specific exonuclease RecJ [Clostridia bacterium]|nr:single-stranded-DNA-specific exonuclease RecJ [Clostridia bacterium]